MDVDVGGQVDAVGEAVRRELGPAGDGTGVGVPE